MWFTCVFVRIFIGFELIVLIVIEFLSEALGESQRVGILDLYTIEKSALPKNKNIIWRIRGPLLLRH